MPIDLRNLKWNVKAVLKDLLTSPSWADRPQHLYFEITAACDSRCIHCPRHDMDRPMRIMDVGLFRKLIDEADALGVPEICPNGYGEICTIPVDVLRDYFGYIASRARRFKVLINTNAHRLDEQRAALFIDHEVKLVNVTIEGATARTFEAIRLGLSLPRIEENIERLLRMRKARKRAYPKVRVGILAMPQTMDEIAPFLERWQGVADFVGVGGFSSRLGARWGVVRDPEVAAIGKPDAPPPGPEPAHGPSACVLPFRDLNIWSDGKAVVCCEDWNEELVVGDLNTQSLQEVWNSSALNDVRRKHLAGLGHEVDLCSRCNNWSAPSKGARLWHS